jgi:phage portal protein BeeE
MINEMDGATFSNIEHQSIEFVTYGIGSWIEKIEQEYRRKLLKESEKSKPLFQTQC